MSQHIITEDILEQARAGEMGSLKAIPKTDLHTHLILSAPFSTYQRMSQNKIALTPPRFENLGAFLVHVRQHFFPIFTSSDSYREIMRDSFSHMIADGITYSEISFDTAMPLLLGVEWPELVERIGDVVDEFKDRIVIKPEIGLARDFLHPDAQRMALQAIDTGFFSSVDLYGAEEIRPIEEFHNYLSYARKKGLKVKIHSGETGAAPRIRHEFRSVRPDAIQHGVRASEDATLMEELAKAGVEVNVCPYSNWYLSVVDEYRNHPIRKLFDAGVRVTVNSDDYGVFGKSVSEEYLELYTQKIFTAPELEQIRQNGLRVI